MKKKNSYQRILERYREYLKKYIQEEEVRAALDVPLDKLNLNNVMYFPLTTMVQGQHSDWRQIGLNLT